MEHNDAASTTARPDRPPYGRRRAVAATIVAAPVVLLVALVTQCGDDEPSAAVVGRRVLDRRDRGGDGPRHARAGAGDHGGGDAAAASAPATTAPRHTDARRRRRAVPTPLRRPRSTRSAARGGSSNRDRPLPDGYVPAELVTPDVPLDPDASFTQLTPETAAAFEQMAAAAAIDGHQLQLNSAYRSESDQAQLYERYVRDYGAESAARLVARPGTSEHQTGLAADVGLVGLPDDQTFGTTEASTWVADNAHRFGLIVRYPPDKAEITGYANEPWHLRYVGVELAGALHATGLTMEEHFGLAG